MPSHLMLGRLRVLVAVGLIVAPFAMSPRQSSAQEDLTLSGGEGGMSALDFDSARMSFFNQADINADFALSSGEMSDAMAHGGSSLFDGLDLDGDGQISFDEYLQHGNDLFLSLDLDGDGFLSSSEM